MLIVAPLDGAVAAARHAKPKSAASAGQTWRWGRCSVSIPKGWGDYRGGKADPKDHEFNVTLGAAASGTSMAKTLKAMRGRTISDGKDSTVVRVQLRRRGAQQYWAVTKSTPACRATVTYDGPAQEGTARKIAESLKRGR